MYATLPYTHWGAAANQAYPLNEVNAKIEWIRWNSDRKTGASHELYIVDVPVIVAMQDMIDTEVMIDYGSDVARHMAFTSAQVSTNDEEDCLWSSA